MNIVYNRQITDNEVRLLKLMEEFMFTYLEDKDLLDKIIIQFNEVEDKENGLSYVGKVKFKPSQPFRPIIIISDYAVRLFANACILTGRGPFNSYEKYRYKVIFHELAHVVHTYNDPEQLYIMTRGNKRIYDNHEEDSVNQFCDEFLKMKNVI